jgi:hypothetical protein
VDLLSEITPHPALRRGQELGNVAEINNIE